MAVALPPPPRKRRALYPNWEKDASQGKGRLRRSTARKVYRKDAKGGAAHSVRDRLTAPLAKPLRLWGAKWEWPQPPSPPHRHCLSIAYLSGRCVTCHLQARRKACTTRAQPSLTATPPRSLHSPLVPALCERGCIGSLSRAPKRSLSVRPAQYAAQPLTYLL